jgi:hypothetical protein
VCVCCQKVPGWITQKMHVVGNGKGPPGRTFCLLFFHIRSIREIRIDKRDSFRILLAPLGSSRLSLPSSNSISCRAMALASQPGVKIAAGFRSSRQIRTPHPKTPTLCRPSPSPVLVWRCCHPISNPPPP